MWTKNCIIWRNCTNFTIKSSPFWSKKVRFKLSSMQKILKNPLYVGQKWRIFNDKVDNVYFAKIEASRSRCNFWILIWNCAVGKPDWNRHTINVHFFYINANKVWKSSQFGYFGQVKPKPVFALLFSWFIKRAVNIAWSRKFSDFQKISGKISGKNRIFKFWIQNRFQ